MCCTRLAGNTGRKNRHFGIIAQLCRPVSSYLRHISTIRKNLLNIDTSCTCLHNMVNFGLLTAEIFWRVWGAPAHINGFRVLAALLHGAPVLGVSQALRRWKEGATYIRQGGHHVEHWPTFLVYNKVPVLLLVLFNAPGLFTRHFCGHRMLGQLHKKSYWGNRRLHCIFRFII